MIRLVGAYARRDLAAWRDSRGGWVRAAVRVAVLLVGLWHLAKIVPPDALARAGGTGAYFPFALLGFALLGLCGAAGGAPVSAVRGEQARGTLEFLLLSPLRPAAWIAAASVLPLVSAAARAGAWIALVVLLQPASAGGLAAAAGVAVLGAAAAYAWGLAVTAMALRGIPRAGGGWAASALLGGVLFPVDLFPVPIRAVAYCLPITHAAAGVRSALAGDTAAAAVHAGALALLAVVGALAGGWYLASTLRRLRVTGDFS